MSGIKATPGPWVVNDTHPTRACLYISSPDDLHKTGDVATVYCAGTPSYEQDAHLIAAARELYEAMDLALTDLHVCGNVTPETCNLFEKVMAKARGES